MRVWLRSVRRVSAQLAGLGMVNWRRHLPTWMTIGTSSATGTFSQHELALGIGERARHGFARDFAARITSRAGGNRLDRGVGNVNDDVVERVDAGGVVDDAADGGRAHVGARLHLAPGELAVVLKALEVLAGEAAGGGVARRDAGAARADRAAGRARPRRCRPSIRAVPVLFAPPAPPRPLFALLSLAAHPTAADGAHETNGKKAGQRVA